MKSALVFIAPEYVPGKPVVRIIRDKQGGLSKEGELFKKLPKGYGFNGFEFTSNLADADFVLVPQAIRRLDSSTARYLEEVKAMATKAQKRVIVFSTGDDSYRVHIDGVILFTRSAFRFDIHTNEITMPLLAEDFSEYVPLTPRPKSPKPVISFCGYAGFPSLKTRAKYLFDNAYLDLRALITGNPSVRANKRGIYFRRKAMGLLRRDPRFETNFIVRNTFSGNSDLIVGEPGGIRKEYIDSIQHADFVLCPRGDANQSVRFFETLSLGRIPVLIDTEMVLPLEDLIDYDQFIVRVPFADLNRIGEYITKWYDTLSDQEWARRQQLARQAFEKHLRYDSFFNTVFPILVERYSPQARAVY